MKSFFLVLAFLFPAFWSSAQTNAPVKLALVAETGEAGPALDVLTASLSGNGNVQLLERSEIDRVYREQGMSKGNRDDIKAGRILGADGLLLLDVLRTRQATNLVVRLVAVKPGVVLADEAFSWPIENIGDWASPMADHLALFLAKLALSVKDAIPISVVNLRSAISSSEEQEIERQLKLLTIQRLSREPQFFVLERERMQTLGEEKALQVDESAFWNGAYLLEGIIDQNGFSKDLMTIDVRLSPAKGGTSLSFKVTGDRTNLASIVNSLAMEVAAALKVNASIKEWNAIDEAAQYYDESKWALRWGIFPEAQAAADSSWALGKKDADSALVRVGAYLGEVSASMGKYRRFKEDFDNNLRLITVHTPPSPDNIGKAIHALEVYYEFDSNLSDAEAKVVYRRKGPNNLQNSDWAQAGLNDLDTASSVLLSFNAEPKSAVPVAADLGRLRSLVRTVAGHMSKEESQFARVNHRFPDVARAELLWGCLWQETPENTVTRYRELTGDLHFSDTHMQWWIRQPLPGQAPWYAPEARMPRLTAWNDADRNRLPDVWDAFLRELDGSTNVYLNLEGKALRLADAHGKDAITAAFTNLLDAFVTNYVFLMTNDVDQLAENWGINWLINEKADEEVVDGVPRDDWLINRYHAEYDSRLLDENRKGQKILDERRKVLDDRRWAAVFDDQKRFLVQKAPFNFFKFTKLFESFTDYSPAQAAEILPLFQNYKTNVTIAAQYRLWIDKLEKNICQGLKPSTPTSPPPGPPLTASSSTVVSKPLTVKSEPQGGLPQPKLPTHVMTVARFIPVPWESLPAYRRYLADNSLPPIAITAHHWVEGRLVVDFRENLGIEAVRAAIAIFDPDKDHWDVVSCPVHEAAASLNTYFHQTTLFHGALYNSDDGQIRRYDFVTGQWKVLPFSDGGNYELFNVNGHLYAANSSLIFEITGTNQTLILASTRRMPVASLLDREDLGTPTLFEGPGHSLRVVTKNKIFTWLNNDWREDSTCPEASVPPEISEGGIIFYNERPFRLSRLSTEAVTPELCMAHETRFSGMPSPEVTRPLWSMDPELYRTRLPAALYRSGLHLLAKEQDSSNAAYDFTLLSFSSANKLPQKLFLKFADTDAGSPSPTVPRDWICFSPHFLIFGVDHAKTVEWRAQFKIGIWLMPVSELDSVADAQKTDIKSKEPAGSMVR